MQERNIALLYCKWCPNDCKGLTDEEKIGCLAASGFADEFLQSLSKGMMGEEPPVIPETDVMQWMGRHKKSGWMTNYSMEAQRDADMEWFKAQRIRDQAEKEEIFKELRKHSSSDNSGTTEIMFYGGAYQFFESKYIKGGK